jgi:membrane protein DedA with SNARE-associated domain
MAIIDALLPYTEHFGYIAIFGLLTGSSFGLPIPEDATLLVAGWLASQHYVQLPFAILVGLLGIFVGDNVGFRLGQTFKGDIRKFLLKFGHRFFLSKDKVNNIYQMFRTHPERTVFLARFFVGLRLIAPIIAGSSGMKWRKFIGYNFAGALILVPTVMLIGFKFGENLDLIYKIVRDFGIVITIIALAIIIPAIFFYRKRKSRHR